MKKQVSAGLVCLALVGGMGFHLTRHPDATPVKVLHVTAKMPLTPPTCSISTGKLLQYINTERLKRGTQSLLIDPRLNTTSQKKLKDMVHGKYYGHYGLNGDLTYSTLLQNQGIYGKAGEDLDDNAISADAAWQAFKGSSAHYASLTSATYQHVGISAACNLDYTVRKDTSPDIEADTTGDVVGSLVVIHLAQ